MKNSRISKIWASVVLVAGFVMGPACSHSVAAEAGLINVARSQELQPEAVWSDSLHTDRMLPASRPEVDAVGALEDDEDMQRYVQMHEDALDSPLRSFILPWSTLQQNAN
jgi:hypothetical protein